FLERREGRRGDYGGEDRPADRGENDERVDQLIEKRVVLERVVDLRGGGVEPTEDFERASDQRDRPDDARAAGGAVGFALDVAAEELLGRRREKRLGCSR
ncbi:MAG: hypothetical protein QXG03_07020, partial [Halalkalicoccus sp.]